MKENKKTDDELIPEFSFEGDFIEIDTDNLETIEPSKSNEENEEETIVKKDEEDDKEYFEYDSEKPSEIIEDDVINEDLSEKPADVETEEQEENLYSGIATLLRDEDILDGIQDDDISNITDSETLVKALNNKINQVVDGTLSDINSKSHNAISHFINGGTEEEYVKAFNNRGDAYTTYTEEDIKDSIEIQKKIADTYFRKTSPKMTEKVRKRTVDNIVEIDGEDVVMSLQQELVEMDAQEKEEFAIQEKIKQEERINQQKIFQQTLRDNTLNTVEFLPGRKLDKKTKEKIYNNITPTVDKIQKDFVKYAPILAYLDHYNILDGDFTKVVKDIQTKKNADLGMLFSKHKSKSHTSNNRKTEEENDINWMAKESLRRKK